MATFKLPVVFRQRLKRKEVTSSQTQYNNTRNFNKECVFLSTITNLLENVHESEATNNTSQDF